VEVPELAIRSRRAAFNRALADGDLGAISPLLVAEAMLVTGTDSAVLPSRKAQLHAWKQEFAEPDRAIYTRLPASIEVSTVAPVALEHGKWRAVTVAGEHVASGSYTAKWREVRDEWVIEAEIYLTLA